MSLAKRMPLETEPARSADATAMVVGYMRYYMVHSTYAEISRVDGEFIGSATYAATVAPGRRLVVVRMTQVSAMNPMLFGESGCAFELDAVAGATYQLMPPDMRSYRKFWSRLPGATPKRFETTLLFNVSVEGAEKQRMEVAADCGNPTACRTSTDCEFMNESVEPDSLERVVCVRQPHERFGRCLVAPGAADDNS